MACVVEQDDQVEAMVDTLTIDEAPMEDEESVIQYEDAESISELEEQSEEAMTTTTSSLDSEEAEDGAIKNEEKQKAIIPPLRPLTIAPKPAKLPVSIKPVAGQQLLLVQGGGAGQQIKLLSTAQALSLSNLSIAKPITIKQSPKASTISIVQPKKVVMKKVVPKTLTKAFDGKSGQQIVVLQKSDNQVKLLPTSGSKTLTLSQAQQMGLISSTKIIPHGAKQILLNKGGQSKAIKIIPHIRPPTKILPAPQTTTSSSVKGPQRIFLSKTNVGPTHIMPGQIIQVPNSQSGQLHPINIPGKGLQYIKIITTTQSPDAQTTTTAATVGKVVTTKVTSVGTAQSPKSFIKITKPITPVSGMRALPIVPVKQQIVTARISSSSKQSQEEEEDETPSSQTSTEVSIESNGIKTRKPCNCAKSQCLKLYCDCFANGEFCFMCNCTNCYNNLENEEHRNRAIKNCLERNPNAFRPKIGKGKETGEVAVRKHTKGCNCKRSGCLKNYCECYEAKIACSNNCKCLGCKNVESGGGLSIGFGAALQSAADESNFLNSVERKSSDSNHRGRRSSSARQPFNFINNAVVEATSQCLITKAKTGEEIAETEELSKREIIEEFGRCLKQIIDCSASKDMQVK